MLKMKTTGILAGILISTVAGAKMYANHVAKSAIDDAIGMMSSVANIQYESVSAGLVRSSVTLKDVKIQSLASGEKYAIHRIKLDNVNPNNPVPEDVGIELEGVEIWFDPRTEWGKILTSLGYTNPVIFNFKFESDYDLEDLEFEITDLMLEGKNIGKVNLTLSMENLNLDPSAAVLLPLTYPGIRITEARLEFEDDSIVDRIIANKANNMHLSVSEMKQIIDAGFEKEIANETDSFTKEAKTAMRLFLNNPKTITVKASPKEPVPVGSLIYAKQYDEWIKLLNLSVKS